MHVLTLDLHKGSALASNIDEIEKAHQRLNILVWVKKLLEERAVDHVIDDADVVIFPILFKSC